MKRSQRKIYAMWVLFTEAIGFLAGLLIRENISLYSSEIANPPLSPPAIIFPVVWAILYALMGISAARIYLSPYSSDAHFRNLMLFLLQLAVNFFWSIIFFNFQAFGFACIWLILLWILILLMIVSFYKIDQTAALLQIPYLLWVTFAAYLNFGIWLLNR